jgi:putative DNA-invertase from lambdoid prophage Rac
VEILRDVFDQTRVRVWQQQPSEFFEEAILDVDGILVALTEALDLTTPMGRATAGMVAVFAEFERELLRVRVRARIAQARREGRPHGRPRTSSLKAEEVRRLKAERVSHAEIARRLGIGRTSVRRILTAT